MRCLDGWGYAVMATILLLGCGGKAVFDGYPETGGGGTAGTGGTGGTSTTTHTTTTSSTGGTGGSPQCGQTHDRFELALQTYEGEAWGCDGTGPLQGGSLTLQGAVTEQTGSGFVLDSCPPNMDCMPMLSQLAMDAPGLAAYLPLGVFVELRVQVSTVGEGCAHQLEIWNLPTWGGEPNPGGSLPWLWLAAADGVADTISQQTLTLTPIALGCYPGQTGCGVPPEDFVLRLAHDCAPDQPVELAMGQSQQWSIGCFDEPPIALVRNLRSYESGYCDDYGNWAFYYDATYGIN